MYCLLLYGPETENVNILCETNMFYLQTDGKYAFSSVMYKKLNFVHVRLVINNYRLQVSNFSNVSKTIE